MSVTRWGLSNQTIHKISSVFQTFSDIQKVILYGSRAKGNFSPGSDIDLTVVAPEMDLVRLMKLEMALEDLSLPYKIDLSLFHQIDQTSLLEHIERVGITFYPSE